MPFLRSHKRKSLPSVTENHTDYSSNSDQIMSSVPMSEAVKLMSRSIHQSRFPFTTTEISPASSCGPIITVDMSSSNNSETSQSPLTPLDEDNSLNTATLHQSVADSPTPPTYTTAKSLLTSVSIAPQSLAQESRQTCSSVMKQSGGMMTGPAIGLPHFYFPKMGPLGVISPVNLQSSFELGLRLKQTLDSCQSSETEAGMEERRKIVEELDSLVKHWVRNKVSKQGMRKNYVERVGGKVVTYGSFKLGVVDKDSDLDLLAVVPRFVNREEFFEDFYSNLARRSCDVTELRSLSTAFVPVIKFKYRGIDVDLTLARLTTDYVREDEDFLDQPFISRDLDPRCLRSLNGYRATKELLQLVPSVERFQLVLRLVKLWARTQGIYGNILGYLGGASWAILVAKACQIEADMQGCQLPVSHLVFLFFKIFSVWSWPMPVYIKPLERQSSHGWNPEINYCDRGHLMPIITSSIPEMNSAVNVAEENLSLIQRKLTEARDICKDVFDGSRTWQDLFQTRLFFHEFEYFLEVTARAKTDLCMWFGLVESKLRTLCVMIRTCPRIQQVQIWPIPFPGSKGAVSGFSQSWYIGCRFQDKGEGSLERMKEILESPLTNFSMICEESVRRLAHYPAKSFQTSWTLLLQSRLPSNLTDMLRKKPSYASVTQGLETQRLGNLEDDVSGHILPREDVVRLNTPSTILGLHGNRAQSLDPRAPILSSSSSVAGSQYYSTIASPLHDQYIQGRMLYTPSTSSIIYSTSSRNISANMSGYRDLRPSPSPVFTSVLPVAPTDTYPTYPPITSLPPPYSPANLFTSPPPPHGMTLSPALCMGCNLPSPGCKCHSPRSRTSCSTNYQDASGQSHHSGKEPRTDSRDSSERLRSVSWTEDKFPPPALAMARISHQDQLPASVSPGYRDLSGVVPLPSHVDTSVPPPPRPTVPPSASIQQHPPVVSSYQASLQSCKENLPLTFDNARMSASRKNRTRSPRTSISEINDWSAPQPVTHTQQGSIRLSLANTDTVFH